MLARTVDHDRERDTTVQDHAAQRKVRALGGSEGRNAYAARTHTQGKKYPVTKNGGMGSHYLRAAAPFWINRGKGGRPRYVGQESAHRMNSQMTQDEHDAAQTRQLLRVNKQELAIVRKRAFPHEQGMSDADIWNHQDPAQGIESFGDLQDRYSRPWSDANQLDMYHRFEPKGAMREWDYRQIEESARAKKRAKRAGISRDDPNTVDITGRPYATEERQRVALGQASRVQTGTALPPHILHRIIPNHRLPPPLQYPQFPSRTAADIARESQDSSMQQRTKAYLQTRP
jgi:hypothetical protein